MEDNGHIAKMIRDAITVCDKNRDSATSNQLQDIWTRQTVVNGSFMKYVGIKEHRMIQLRQQKH